MRPASRGRAGGRIRARALAILVLVSTWTMITGWTGWAPPASAHDELLATDPAEGSRLDVAPAQIRLTFRTEVVQQFVTVTVTIDQGQATTLPTRVDGVAVIVDIPATGPAGVDWSVAYRVVSSDGHPVTGTIRFSVPGPAAPTAAPSATASPTGTVSPEPTSTHSGPLPATEPRPRPGAWWPFALMAAVLVLIPVSVVSIRRDEGDRTTSHPEVPQQAHQEEQTADAAPPADGAAPGGNTPDFSIEPGAAEDRTGP